MKIFGKPSRLVTGLGLMLLLAACEHTTLTSVSSGATFCQAYKRITWSDKDTDETIAQIKETNAVHTALCIKPKK